VDETFIGMFVSQGRLPKRDRPELLFKEGREFRSAERSGVTHRESQLHKP
jgi:hypothetical protein